MVLYITVSSSTGSEVNGWVARGKLPTPAPRESRPRLDPAQKNRPAPVTLTVAGKVVTGEIKLDRDTEIRGTVWEDGSFGATIGFNQLTGQFSRNAFEGEFETSDCTWKMSLKRKPGP